MALWLCRAGKYGEHEDKFLSENRIYATWSELRTNLSKITEMVELFDFLRATFTEWSKAKATQYTGQIYSFAQRMKPGDWIAVPTKRKAIHIGMIKGEYQYDESAEDPYYHWRSVEWLETDIPRTNFDQDILNSLGAFTTICRIKRNDAESRVRSMLANGWKSTGIKPKLPDHGENGENGEHEDTGDLTQDLDLEDIATDQIARLIYRKYKGSGLENLVEAVLIAQGYTTYHSPEGADGGVDILAAPGTLGFGNPRICVQVKSQSEPVERTVLDQLIGTMQNVGAEQGLLVSWGGFKRTIRSEESRLCFKVRLWDQRTFIEELLTHYDNLDEDIKADLPLKRIWAVASPSEDE